MPIQKNPQKLLEILHHLPLATAIYDSADLRIAFANQTMLNIWLRDDSIIGRYFSDVFPAFKEGGFSSILEKVWEKGENYIASDTPAIIDSGSERSTRYFDFEFRALLDADNKTYAILHTATDVTQNHVDRQVIFDQRKQISFNSELETLTYTLSHDAKKPLSVAKLGLGYLNAGCADNTGKEARWHEVVHDALNDLDLILTKTAQLSEARAYDVKPMLIALNDRIPKWIDQAKLIQARADILVETHSLVPVYGDPAALYHIFSNIIENAIKYSIPDGTPWLRIVGETLPHSVRYVIEDQGRGIPEAELSSIFSATSRGSNTQGIKGQGIGLYIVKQLMRRLGGEIAISSKVGEGTQVRLLFPSHPQ